MARTAAAPNYLETDDGLKYLGPVHSAAWVGLLGAHAGLTRTLDAELTRGHRLSLSAYELLSRLAHAEQGWLRVSELAEQSGLSVSRVSRMVDQLAGDGAVQKSPCPGDSRVVHVQLTPEGREKLRDAQETFHAVMEERFLSRLSCAEVETLGKLLGRLCDGRGGCAT